MRWFKLFGIWIAILLVIGLFQSSEIHASRILIASCVVLVIIFYIRTRIHQQRKNQFRLQSEALAAVEILRTHLKPEPPINNLVDVVSKVNVETAAVMNSRPNGKLPRLDLMYTNTRDITQKRLISPYRSGANVDYFSAWCFMEDEKRSFCFYRVQWAVNTETGEILSQADLYRLIHPKRMAPDWLRESID